MLCVVISTDRAPHVAPMMETPRDSAKHVIFVVCFAFLLRVLHSFAVFCRFKACEMCFVIFLVHDFQVLNFHY